MLGNHRSDLRSRSDIFGRKGFLLTLMASFMLTSLACGLSHTMNQLIAFRALQGVGVRSSSARSLRTDALQGAALLAIPQSISCDVVCIEDRPKYQMIFEVVLSCTNAFAPLLGGLLADANWRWYARRSQVTLR
jgi:MFS family permease